ncbi:MAG: caspase family protein [Phaeodactylibacter sp.]|nr:caspase family protein [Phaeodactylibacter sp.]
MADKGITIGETEQASGKRTGINYLLAIAIDEYKHCPRLYNCVQDARRLIAVLSSQYQFDKENTFTLFNEQATEHAIIDIFKKLVRLIRPEDNLLILFSGHGEYEEEIEEGYWIPVDAPLGHTNEYIANSRIIKYIRAIRSHHTFLIVDSCFSGSLFASRSLEPSDSSKRLDEIPSRWLLTAGRNELVSDGKPGGHSPFADNVIYFLENNRAPSLSVAKLISQVVNAVIYNARQTPRGEPLQDVGHRGGQFHFYRKGYAPDRKAASAATPEPDPPRPPGPDKKKYWIAGMAVLALLAFVLIRQNGGPAAGKSIKEQESAGPVIEKPALQARYDSLVAAGIGLFRQARSREHFEEALGLFGQARQLAEENSLDPEAANRGIQQCRQRLSELDQAESNQEVPSSDYATLLARAQALIQKGQYADARQILEETLKLKPKEREAQTLLRKCREELDWQRVEKAREEDGYRNYLKAYPNGSHIVAAQQKIAALHRYELYFTTSLKQDNLLTINIGKGKPPFDITITNPATGEQIRKTNFEGLQLEVSLSRFNGETGNHLVEIIVRDHNFKAKGQKLPLM